MRLGAGAYTLEFQVTYLQSFPFGLLEVTALIGVLHVFQPQSHTQTLYWLTLRDR